MKKTAIRVGDTVLSVDTIEHEGDFWIVPEWIEHLAEGTIQPVRMIRVLPPSFHSAQGTEFDFALTDPISTSVLEGKSSEGFDVCELPDLQFDNRAPSSLH